jgi:pimeloyl-ACP methyl ester carboxylesterase
MTVERFAIDVPDEILEDLQHRLAHVRWPMDNENDDWRYGVNREYLEEVIAYWRTTYDWRAVEQRMNSFANFKTTIDDVPIHFIHEPGVGPAPIPLIMSHGWPWSFWDFEKMIRPLTDPASYGGDSADAFDVIVPSLPGFGFSTPLKRTGINFHKTADLWVKLMREELGYDKFAAQGGDWGQLVTSQMGHKYPEHLIGLHVHLSLPLDFFTFALPTEDQYADDEKHFFHQTQTRMVHAAPHLAVQTKEPETLSYAMHDSPVGLLAWLMERRRHWSDSNGDIETRFPKEDSITLAMMYWVSEAFVTSARFYWEAANDLWKPSHHNRPVISAPTGMAIFPKDLLILPRAWMEEYYNLHRLTYMKSGGHFGAAEEPEALVTEIREFFRPLRS